MRAWLLIAILLLDSVAAAEPVVPAPLEPWRAWVLKDHEFRACPLIAGRAADRRESFVCAWPGVLSLDADADGIDIAQRWTLETDGWASLPGDAAYWPQDVVVDGKPAIVIDRNGPTLWLGAGRHDVRARIEWDQRPQTLVVPDSIALIALRVDGKPVSPVQRGGNSLTLGRGVTAAVEADSVDLRVFRLYTDGIPGQLTTRIRVFASGQAREEVFGPVLPDGFIPLALDSESWPARLDEKGLLHVQVQPGEDTFTLTARALLPIDTLVARMPEEWAQQEIWSYQAAPRLRVTGISGAVQVDPRQADVPEEWAGFPAYALDDKSTLTIEQRSRGGADDEANRLTLHREAWLDFSGDGWFARDRIVGRMQSGWRFDAAAPFSLERAETTDDGGAIEPMLVTRGARAELSGVEWRTPQVDLRAGLRIANGVGSLPVTGWQQVFDQVTTTLHLPHGYRLIAAPGTDRANGSWLSRWTLLDVFIAAIMVLLAARLLGWIGGVVAALYFLFGYQEAGAPLWTLLAVLACALVARALPQQGRLARVAHWARLAAFVLLIIAALPFAAKQLRLALYPQLEAGAAFARPAAPAFWMDAVQDVPVMMSEPSPAPPPAPPQSLRAQVEEAGEKLERISVTGSRIRNSDQIRKYSENTVVQTGAGEPGWRLGNSYTLNWSGPVLPTQDVDLVVARPWLVRGLRVLLVALLGWLLWRVARGAALPRFAARATAPCALLLAASMLGSAPSASAQDWPPDSMLDELRARLIEAPRCAPQCASIAQAQVTARGDEIRVVLEVHAAARVALPLPADERSAVLRSVLLDGAVNDALVRSAGKPWIALGRGVHRIEMIFAAAADKIDLAFGMAPHRVVFDGSNWQASGIAEQRLLTEALVLVRAREDSDQRPLANEQQFPAYVRVTRRLNLDLDWSVSSTAQRLAPRDGGFTFSLPIIGGERVTTPGLRVRDGKLTLALPDGEQHATWSSTLEQTDSLSLTAPPLGEHAEVWRVLVSPTWHVEFSGVPESGVGPDAELDDYRKFEFHPLPGESLTLTISKPAAVEGATRAIDKVDLSSDFGQRAGTHVLRFDVRASQGGEQSIMLPAEAEVIGVTRAGQSMPPRALDGKLSIPLQPGTQAIEIRFRENAPLGWKAATPAVALGLPAANIDLRINLPRDRWLLAAFGPAVGPAVLFWGELVVMLVLAWMLARWTRTPLRFHHWLLLGLGFSTFSWVALGVVVVWLFALDARKRAAPARNWQFNLVQVGLVALTVIALGCLVANIHNGLLGEPDMVVSGSDSFARNLHWFADRSSDALPTASVWSLPLWVYNLVMLAWALWLAWAVVGWLRNGFAAWSTGGYWRAWREPRAEPVIDVPPAAPPAQS